MFLRCGSFVDIHCFGVREGEENVSPSTLVVWVQVMRLPWNSSAGVFWFGIREAKEPLSPPVPMVRGCDDCAPVELLSLSRVRCSFPVPSLALFRIDPVEGIGLPGADFTSPLPEDNLMMGSLLKRVVICLGQPAFPGCCTRSYFYIFLVRGKVLLSDIEVGSSPDESSLLKALLKKSL